MRSINQRVLSLTLAGLLGSAFALPSLAAGDFKSYDGNGDGKISKKEYQAKGGSDSEFSAMDANGDGNLSSSEFGKAGSSGGSSGGSMPPAPAPAPGGAPAPGL